MYMIVLFLYDYSFCIDTLIRDGKAYVDNTPGEVMKQERESRTPSKCRDKCKQV